MMGCQSGYRKMQFWIAHLLAQRRVDAVAAQLRCISRFEFS